jgi:hypothetical protein
MNTNKIISVFTLLFIACTVQETGYAQLTGQITGTIQDASGAVVPSATITVVNESTGIRREAQTNADGFYTNHPFRCPTCRRADRATGFFAGNRRYHRDINGYRYGPAARIG